MEGLEMAEKEQAAIMIDIYTDLQRIQKAEDKDRNYLISFARRKRNLKHWEL